MSADEEYVEAREDAERARARLAVTAAEIKARLNPSTIAQDQLSNIREKVTDASSRAIAQVKAHPAATAAAVAAVTAFLFRGVIGRGLKALRGKSEPSDPTDDAQPHEEKQLTTTRRAALRRAAATPRRPRPGGRP